MREHPTPTTMKTGTPAPNHPHTPILHRGIQQKAPPPHPPSNNLSITKTLRYYSPPPPLNHNSRQDCSGIPVCFCLLPVMSEKALVQSVQYLEHIRLPCPNSARLKFHLTVQVQFNCNILHLKTPNLILTLQQAAICTEDLCSLISATKATMQDSGV